MGAPKPPRPVKWFVGALTADMNLLDGISGSLVELLGPIDVVSGDVAFDRTTYYRDEMGEGILRRFLFFEAPGSPDRLPEIKLATNALEAAVCDRLSRPYGRRPLNLDPGYMTLSKLVLATTKDYSHRLYLASGIYAEVTLHYENGEWRPFPWTYPDYAGSEYHAAFIQAREKLKVQLREFESGGKRASSPPTAGSA